MKQIILLTKYLCLLGLCAPFLVIALKTGDEERGKSGDLYELTEKDGLPLGGGAAATDSLKKLKDAGEIANQLSDSLREAHSAVTCVWTKKIAMRAGQVGKKVVEATRDRATDLADTANLIDAVSKLESGNDVQNPFDETHPYSKYFTKRQDDLTRAHQAFSDLNKDLDKLERDFKKALNDAKDTDQVAVQELAVAIDKRVKQLKDCQREQAGAGIRAKWLREQLAGWENARRMLTLAASARGVAEGKEKLIDVPTLLQQHSKLLNTTDFPPEFRTLVIGMARHFCEQYLPERLDLDDYVLFLSSKDVQWAKDDITIYFENGTRPPFRNYNEFDLEKDEKSGKVVNYYNKSLKVSENPPVKPTPLSCAAQRYNVSRQRLPPWTYKSMQKLLADCKDYQEDLGKTKYRGKPWNTWQKVECLAEAVKDRDDLFPSE